MGYLENIIANKLERMATWKLNPTYGNCAKNVEMFK